MLKILPMLLALVALAHTVFAFLTIELPVLSYIGGTSLLPLVFMYISSYVFKFCSYHRMFLHYVLANNVINTYDLYIGIPISDLLLFEVHMSLVGICLFIILYLYVANTKKNVTKDSG